MSLPQDKGQGIDLPVMHSQTAPADTTLASAPMLPLPGSQANSQHASETRPGTGNSRHSGRELMATQWHPQLQLPPWQRVRLEVHLNDDELFAPRSEVHVLRISTAGVRFFPSIESDNQLREYFEEQEPAADADGRSGFDAAGNASITSNTSNTSNTSSTSTTMNDPSRRPPHKMVAVFIRSRVTQETRSRRQLSITRQGFKYLVDRLHMPADIALGMAASMVRLPPFGRWKDVDGQPMAAYEFFTLHPWWYEEVGMPEGIKMEFMPCAVYLNYEVATNTSYYVLTLSVVENCMYSILQKCGVEMDSETIKLVAAETPPSGPPAFTAASVPPGRPPSFTAPFAPASASAPAPLSTNGPLDGGAAASAGASVAASVAASAAAGPTTATTGEGPAIPEIHPFFLLLVVIQLSYYRAYKSIEEIDSLVFSMINRLDECSKALAAHTAHTSEERRQLDDIVNALPHMSHDCALGVSRVDMFISMCYTLQKALDGFEPGCQTFVRLRALQQGRLAPPANANVNANTNTLLPGPTPGLELEPESELTRQARDSLTYLISMLVMVKDRAMLYNAEKVTAMNLANNLIAQQDSAVNIQMAQQATKHSSSMNTITIVTLVFLPGTFIATIFGSGIIDGPTKHHIADTFYPFIICTAVLTLLIVALWYWRITLQAGAGHTRRWLFLTGRWITNQTNADKRRHRRRRRGNHVADIENQGTEDYPYIA